MKQHEFRERFRTEHIFKINVAEPYKLLDKVSSENNLYPFLSSPDLSKHDCVASSQSNQAVAVMEADMKKLQDTADLFEVSFPEYKQLRQCRSDIILVKAVWDMVIFVKVRVTTHNDFKLHFFIAHTLLSRLSFWVLHIVKAISLPCTVSVTVKHRGLDQDSMEGDQC